MKPRIVMFLFLLFTGCSLVPGHTKNDLLGSWDWVSSVGGFAGWTLTPESEGYHQTLTFYDNQFYVVTRDGEPIEQGMYNTKLVEWDESRKLIIKFESALDGAIVHLSGDTLQLADMCYDCYYHLYIRSK